MVRRLPLLALLIACPAHAEDFGGFYAGVNAGYGWNRDEAKRVGPVALPNGQSPASGASLPPSASAAADALRRSSPDRSPSTR